jgi:hypothetical protein
VMISGESRLGIQVDGAPFPSLRNDAGKTCADADPPVLSGMRTPNSVATLGPVLSCRLPGTRMCLRNAPAVVRLVGPEGDRGVWPCPSNTASHPSLNP